MADKYLYRGILPPTLQPRDRDWFEAIIRESRSGDIFHQKQGIEYAYSTFKINKFITFKDWEIQPQWKYPFKDKTIFPKYYSYFDYIEAWENMLYYQNSQKRHSWFIILRNGEDLIQHGIPNWFKDWFGYFGLTTGLFPTKAYEGFNHFVKANAPIDHLEALIFFSAIYQVPWILKWEDKIIKKTDKGIPYLGKIFFGQWWRKFDDSGLSKKTIQIRLIRQPTESSSSSVSKLISHIEKKKLQPEDKEKLKALLEESENEDDIMNLGSDSDEDYNPCLDIYSQDPNEF